MGHIKTGTETLKLWTIIPWILFWGLIGITINYLFQFNSVGADFTSIYLYIMIFIWIVKELNKRNIRFLDLSGRNGEKVSWWKIIIFIPIVKLASGFIMLVVGIFLLYMFPSIGETSSSTDIINIQPLPMEIFLTFLTTIILAPIIEEIFFRGMMLNKWGQKYGLFKGVIFTSLIFAIVHPVSFFAAFLTSLLYSILYVKTKKLYIPIIAHSFSNLIVLLTRHLLETSVQDEDVGVPTLTDIVLTMGLTITFLTITIYGLYRLYPRDRTLPYLR